MKKCTKTLFEQSKYVEEVLSTANKDNRPLVSQQVLAALRHLTEHVMLVVYCEDNNIDLDDSWINITTSIDYISSHGQYSFIRDFHKNHLQKSVSHRIQSQEYSETLMILYYQPLLEIKTFVFQKYNIEILSNLNKYPLDLDETFLNYYRSIIKVVYKDRSFQNTDNGFYYIYKKKPILVDKKLMYELTLGPANDYADKQDRFIVFSRTNVFDNYAIEAFIIEDRVKIFNSMVSVKILEDYKVSIRTYELNNLITILSLSEKVKKKQEEFSIIMRFIKDEHISLDRITQFSKEKFEEFKKNIKAQTDEIPIVNLLESSREIIINKRKGHNVLKYLLCHIKNSVIRKQMSDTVNPKISNLKFRNGVLPFEETPFAANLLGSKQSIGSILECIEDDRLESQLLSRKITEQSDNTGQLYVDNSHFDNYKDIDVLIKAFNAQLPSFQQNRRIEKIGKRLFINGNEKNTIKIIRMLKARSSKGIPGYKYQAKQWIDQNQGNIKGNEKRSIIENMFDKSRVFVLYGSAGTGKSTTVSFALSIFGNVSKLCLAPTHPAVDNMKRKIKDQNASYFTIKKFLYDNNISGEWDVVVIDECSIVSNEAMIKVLEKLSFGVLLLTGDIFQLPSIDFGNWFHIVKSLLPSYASAELKEQFRTNDNSLVALWEKVRNYDCSIYEYLERNEMTSVLDNSVFDNTNNDQIVLCYNYDGLYGINSINRYLQETNPNEPYYWNQFVYKKDDPIIFHNTKRFNGLLHNNLKGKIVNIRKDSDSIVFDIAIELSLSELSLKNTNLKYVKNLENGWTVIQLSVFKYNDDVDDIEPQEIHTVPFQVSYAVSIHKSQGLEYDSVKIIIANNVDELISHNVFYTAITRARRKLKIYWTPETAAKVLSSFEPHFDMVDCNIIKNKI